MAFRLMRNCNRSTSPGIRAATALTFNWGGIGHGGLKRIFVTKDLRDHEKKLHYNFILAKVEDNPAILEHDPGYLDRLESEPNVALRRAYRHGDPDIIAGQYFDLIREVHTVKPFPIPKYWQWFGSYDYGFNHPAVFLFFVVNADGQVFLIHEIVKARLGLAEQAKLQSQYLKSKLELGERTDESLIFHAGHDCWAKKKGTEPTIAEDFSNHQVVGHGNEAILNRANISRVLGAHRVRQYLNFKYLPDGRRIGPNFFIFDTCIHTIDCLTRMVHDPNNIEDVLKVDSVNGDPASGDDPYDAVRYALMSRPSGDLVSLPAPAMNTLEWFDEQKRQMELDAEERFLKMNTPDDY